MAAGNSYFNVHTEANPGGEIRGQIAPMAFLLGLTNGTTPTTTTTASAAPTTTSRPAAAGKVKAAVGIVAGIAVAVAIVA
jgi:hypothetical protein